MFHIGKIRVVMLWDYVLLTRLEIKVTHNISWQQFYQLEKPILESGTKHGIRVQLYKDGLHEGNLLKKTVAFRWSRDMIAKGFPSQMHAVENTVTRLSTLNVMASRLFSVCNFFNCRRFRFFFRCLIHCLYHLC